ncbi:chromosome partitioning protein ParB [Gordonia amicalis]|uniref:ParB/RepB/Spo0J family partition protein n=1 Tax=Gordonia amicalis TaxID=89053 RepID=UPI0022B31A06|nr:chromosome partitioning protein ParB [Gordonia amicalis]MCZ4581535.1 chromosome partitioning protein ParB [Gordonia amicalis]
MAGKPPAPKKQKTVSRFRNLAGGTDAPAIAGDSSSSDADVTGGVVGGLAAAVQAAGHRIRHVNVGSLIPHPFNDPARSKPVDDDPEWEVLVRNVKANGVLLPGLAVSRAAFIAARPALADSLPTVGTHVLIYGHRRRAAALSAGIPTMPVVVDDSAMANDGDLDYMASENLGRQDLSPIAEAELFARYSEDLGLSQSAIAERLGVDQATVSRRLALLLLTQEAVAELEQERLSVAGAVALAGTLPYGPPRRWQKTKHADQNSAERQSDQIAALRLILDRNTSPTRAAERVLTERESRRRAEKDGIEIVANPREVFGENYLAHQIDDPADANDAVAAIDDTTGALVYYTRTLTPPVPVAVAPSPALAPNATPEDHPQHPPTSDQPTSHQAAVSGIEPATESSAPVVPGDDQTRDPEQAPVETSPNPGKTDSPDSRLEACARAAQTVPGKARLGETLIAAVLLGVDFQNPAVIAAAEAWNDTNTSGDKREAAAAWRRVLAGFEDLVTRQGQWGTAGATYLDILHERAGYLPSTWERQQISVMQRA